MIKSITPIRGMKPRAAIGNTKDPSHFWEIDGPIDRIIKGVGWMLGYPVGGIFEGISSDKNDENAVEGNYTLKHFNEGTPDQPALDAFKHLTGHDQGYIWSSITFYSALGYYHDAPFTRDPKAETFYQGGIRTQVYPSYRIYINGELKSTEEQAASPWALFPNTDRCR